MLGHGLAQSSTSAHRIPVWVMLILLAVVTSTSHAATRPSRRTTQPNVVVILGDGLRASDLTPSSLAGLTNLSTVLQEGFRFTEAYVGSPAAPAARASLLTGIPPEQARIRSAVQEPLLSEEVTIGEMARSVGYSCAYLGVWGLGREGTTGMPILQGFPDFLGMLDLRHGANRQSPFLWRNDVPFKLPPLAGTSREDLPAAWLLRAATNFIHGHEETAFLVVFAPGLPGGTNQPPEVRAARLSRLDAQVGTLTGDLRKRLLSEDTVVILAGVPAFDGVRPLRRNDPIPASTPPTRGLDEATLRTPLVFWRPGIIRPGQTNLPVGLWEIAPTVAALLECQRPAQVTGRSLQPWLMPSTSEAPTNRIVLQWEQVDDPRAQSGRIGRWKGFQAAPEATVQVFDLEQDPGETKDVSGQHPEVVQEFTEIFNRPGRPWSAPTPRPSDEATAAGDQLPTR
jgi:arylsulfatase A